MAHLSGRVVVGVAGLAIVLAMTQIADAQRGERGFGPGPRAGGLGLSSLRLASNERVQEALNLTDEQKQSITEIREQAREAMRDLGRGREAREAREKRVQEDAAKLAEVLSDEQQQRLAGTLVRVNAAMALRDPLVQKQIDLTDDQESRLQEAEAANRRAAREVMADLEDASREERRAKMEELRTTAEKNVMAVLTTEQHAQLDDLRAKAVDVEMRDLREGRPAERRGEGRGRRGRGSI